MTNEMESEHFELVNRLADGFAALQKQVEELTQHNHQVEKLLGYNHKVRLSSLHGYLLHRSHDDTH